MPSPLVPGNLLLFWHCDFLLATLSSPSPICEDLMPQHRGMLGLWNESSWMGGGAPWWRQEEEAWEGRFSERKSGKGITFKFK